MHRSYYSAPTTVFLRENVNKILGELTRNHPFALEDLQRNAWIVQIHILKESLQSLSDSWIAFEYAIPRMGKRVDTVVLYNGIVFLLEFKVGEKSYPSHAQYQVLDYALDLKNFHEASHQREIAPVLVATNAPGVKNDFEKYADGVFKVIKCNKDNIGSTINDICEKVDRHFPIPAREWLSSIYKPTPTIIEAAQALYNGHTVEDISRSDAGAINLSQTSNAISEIIDYSKARIRKSICFVTGVPGSGKTLAGLNIANERHNIDEGEHAVFLSGNGPLVEVLQEALARNKVESQKGSTERITKTRALSETSAFIQNIHHFRDDALENESAPIEKVAVFDEAQRAWTLEQTRVFMERKKGVAGFDMSEPEFLISVLDRHADWAVIICLIGGGQEINTGEAGLSEWFHSLATKFPNWDVYTSSELSDSDYSYGGHYDALLKQGMLKIRSDLHLSVSLRSFRSERISAFVKAILELEGETAGKLYAQIRARYPIRVTRNLEKARMWLRAQARGTESLGIIASSGAHRLKPYGIYVKSDIEPKTWFLNSNDDIRSSAFLEDVATEFEIQGLELDWTCVAWDANLRVDGENWEFKNFRGTEWQNINDDVRKRYLLNSYRVLLTRARQGMVIFVPEGDIHDRTRLPQFYDPIFDYLVSIGIEEI